jgi:hypothetical protein
MMAAAAANRNRFCNLGFIATMAAAELSHCRHNCHKSENDEKFVIRFRRFRRQFAFCFYWKLVTDNFSL